MLAFGKKMIQKNSTNDKSENDTDRICTKPLKQIYEQNMPQTRADF
jgi:hypothetical protein